YYYSDVPFTALWGTRYLGISRPIAEFYAAAKAGTLPAVSFVEPGFLGEAVPGLAEDEHPLADIGLARPSSARCTTPWCPARTGPVPSSSSRTTSGAVSSTT